MQEIIRQAATIILVRDHNNKLEVYMTKRPETMIFLPGYHVFPGGGMQAEDQKPEIHQCCVNRRVEVDLSYPVAAIRECFEEVGYLLADLPLFESNVEFIPPAQLRGLRAQMEAGKVSFHDWVLKQQIRLRTDKMRYFGHRITPRALSLRRFDTRYFLTVVPPGIELEPSQQEVAQAAWLEPIMALEMARRGEISMVPATMDAVVDLASYRSAEDAYRHATGVGTPRPHELA